MVKIYHALISFSLIISFGCEENHKKNNPGLIEKPVVKAPELNKDLIKKLPKPVIKKPDRTPKIIG